MKKIILASILLVVAIIGLKGQGSIYTPGSVITLVNAFPNPSTCLDGNVIILTAPQGGFVPGTMHVCLAHAWLPVVPAGIMNVASSLPATCIAGAVFTISPAGAFWVCPVTNNFTPVAGVNLIKTITNYQDATPLSTLFITIPNVSSSALLETDINSSLGAGGAVGAFESSIGKKVLIQITRVANLASVVNLLVTTTSTAAVSAGAATITATPTLGSLNGGATATQTIRMNLTIARGSGSSNNHVASIISKITSVTPTGITVQ